MRTGSFALAGAAMARAQAVSVATTSWRFMVRLLRGGCWKRGGWLCVGFREAGRQAGARNPQHHGQDEEGMGLAVAVEVERIVDPALEDIVDHEVQGPQPRQFVALDMARLPLREELRHAFYGDLFADQRVEGLVVGDHADIEAEALVAGAPVRDLVQWQFDELDHAADSTRRADS